MNDTTEILAAESVLLGRLAEANYWVCTLEPVAELVDDRWVKFDSQGRFRNGTVKTTLAELGSGTRQVGSLWMFTTREKGTEGDVRAVGPTRAAPMLDLSSCTLAEARRRLTETGISLPEHQSRNVVVLLEGDACCVMKFTQPGPRHGTWIARIPEGSVELYRAKPAWRESIKVQGCAYAPVVDVSGQPAGSLDWSSDVEFLNKVVVRFATAVRGFAGLTERGGGLVVRRLERALSEIGVGTTESAELQALSERLRVEWDVIARGFDALEAIGALLLDSEEGKRLLAEAIDRRTGQLEVELEMRLRREIEERIEPRRREAANLEAAIEGIRARKTQVADGLREALLRSEETKAAAAIAAASLEASRSRTLELDEIAERELARCETARAAANAAEAAAKQFGNRIDGIRREIAEFARGASDDLESTGLADAPRLVALAQRLQARLGDAAQSTSIALPSASPPWWMGQGVQSISVNADDLAERISTESRLHGVEADDLRLLDAFARAGEMVVVTGAHSRATIDAYARVVSAGQLRVQPVDPGVIGLDDLWRSPASGRPTGFAWAWERAAAAPDEAMLIVLDSIDTAPVHLWASALCVALQSPRRPRNLFVLATLSERSVEAAANKRGGWLNHCLVALRPRSATDGAMCAAALGQALPQATRLEAPFTGRYVPDPADLLELSELSGQSRVARRATRLLVALGATEPARAADTAKAWARWIGDEALDGLPTALADGHECLSSLDPRS